MKGIGKLIIAMILAIAISMGAFPTNSAEAKVGGSVSVDVNTTIDQVLDLLGFGDAEGHYVVVVNKTGGTLERVGAYNDSSNWPADDVKARTAKATKIIGQGSYGSHSFAANYEVTETRKDFFQLGSSWPLWGERKINMCESGRSGNKPAEHCWDDMWYSNDVTVGRNGYKGRAFLKTLDTDHGEAIAWLYEIK
ncbi:hypothetical protein D5R40_09040 [Okeania hirsuta]|uniref:Uncharacterized protein n=1 Tax=Okeania hirsuta TaxID=1458930 RepID=A0A3N6PET7_9CYAN|nr:hypothetical protein [Okeania hirsuta]RQH47253.1 hypothetical protein D5R40_09040 [Okeania hirsuta]